MTLFEIRRQAAPQRPSPILYGPARVSLSTHHGCDLGCVFCQCMAEGLGDGRGACALAPPAQIVKALGDPHSPALWGRDIYINEHTEPFLEGVEAATVALVEGLASAGFSQRMIIVSKRPPSAATLARLGASTRRGQLRIFASLADLAGALERAGRAQLLALIKGARDAGIYTGLCVRPLSPRWACLAALAAALPPFAGLLDEVILSGVRAAPELDAALEAYGVGLIPASPEEPFIDPDFEAAVEALIQRGLPGVPLSFAAPSRGLTSGRRGAETIFDGHDDCCLSPIPRAPLPLGD
ncbi:hypothetical protein KKF91_16600 [Myxococcota bacterium]|nr:hypothetical protein [Myxococcota bacterium]MBU1432157.1 hypothetical protein [Myxococcota bacterium]